MSTYKLTTDHSAIMGTSRGITLNTSQSFVPYNINIIPASGFVISEEINKVTYTGHAMDPFVIKKGAELKTIRNEGTVGDIVNNNGTISDIDNRGTIGAISNIIGTTTITNVSGSIVIPSKSKLTGSIVFGGDNGTSDITLKYDSAKGCMVFLYE